MKTTPAENWTNLVKQTAQAKKCNYMDAWRLAANEHPDAAVLMAAFGRARQSAIAFFNSLPIPAACGAEFANELAGVGRKNGGTASKAKFIEIAMPGRQRRPQFANATSAVNKPAFVSVFHRGKNVSFTNAADTSECPVGNPNYFLIFRLPMDTPQDIWCAAWKGNGKTVFPVNYGKAFAGIVDYLQTQKGGTYEAALASAKTLYPDMWAIVQAIAAQPV